MSTFEVGQQVRVTHNVPQQGLRKGETLRIVGVSERRTPFGTFCTYYYQNSEGGHGTVLNGHLLLEPVCPMGCENFPDQDSKCHGCAS